MDYDKIAALCEQLSYRDKFRLAQLLIQLARKEEEEKNPDSRKLTASDSSTITVEHVAERVLKSKPTKTTALFNFIGAMFQFQGGISDEDKEAIVRELQKKKYLAIDGKGRVSYET